MLVSGKVMGGKMVGVRCAHGEVVHYPIVELEVVVGLHAWLCQWCGCSFAAGMIEGMMEDSNNYCISAFVSM